MKALFREVLDDAKAILTATWQVAKRRWLLLLVYFAVVAAAVVAIFPHDRALHDAITADRKENLIWTANKLRRWGDFRDTVTITLVVFAAGAIAKRRSWRTAAIGCFLAASIAGLAVNAVRFTAGRPRPHVEMQDGFYGPTFKYKMQSFPSGHSGTSTACGIALAIALPVAGIPATISAVGVVWACLYAKVHYVTDVLAGACTGLIVGILVGGVTRRRMYPPVPARTHTPTRV